MATKLGSYPSALSASWAAVPFTSGLFLIQSLSFVI
jgi:hypothetical protein